MNENCAGAAALEVGTLLGERFLEQRGPEFVSGFRLSEHQTAVREARQPIVDNHVGPFSETPKTEVEDAAVALRMRRLPFLFNRVRNYLQELD